MNGISHSIMNKLTEYFTPEFLNRLDDIVEFKSLTKPDLLKIVDLMIADTNAMIADQDLTIHVTNPAKAKLVDLGFDPSMGARPLRRTIQEQIEDKVADFYLDNPKEHQLETRVENGEIVITAAKSKPEVATVTTDPTTKNDSDK